MRCVTAPRALDNKLVCSDRKSLFSALSVEEVGAMTQIPFSPMIGMETFPLSMANARPTTSGSGFEPAADIVGNFNAMFDAAFTDDPMAVAMSLFFLLLDQVLKFFLEILLKVSI